LRLPVAAASMSVLVTLDANALPPAPSAEAIDRFKTFWRETFRQCHGSSTCLCCRRVAPQDLKTCTIKMKDVECRLFLWDEAFAETLSTSQLRWLVELFTGQCPNPKGRSFRGHASKVRSAVGGWTLRTNLVKSAPTEFIPRVMLIAAVSTAFKATASQYLELHSSLESKMQHTTRITMWLQAAWRGFTARRATRPMILASRAKVRFHNELYKATTLFVRTMAWRRRSLAARAAARRTAITASFVVPFAIKRAEDLSWVTPARVRRLPLTSAPAIADAPGPSLSHPMYSVLSNQSGVTSSHITDVGPSVSEFHVARRSTTLSTPSQISSFVPPTSLRETMQAERVKSTQLADWRTVIINAKRFKNLSRDATTRDIVLAARADEEFADILPPDNAGIYTIMEHIISYMGM